MEDLGEGTGRMRMRGARRIRTRRGRRRRRELLALRGNIASQVVVAQDPVKDAKALMGKLATAKGRVNQNVLQMRHMNVSSTLVEQLEKVSEALDKIYEIVHSHVQRNQCESESMTVIKAKAQEVLAMYESKCKYARALLNVKKRENPPMR